MKLLTFVWLLKKIWRFSSYEAIPLDKTGERSNLSDDKILTDVCIVGTCPNEETDQAEATHTTEMANESPKEMDDNDKATYLQGRDEIWPR